MVEEVLGGGGDSVPASQARVSEGGFWIREQGHSPSRAGLACILPKYFK